MSIRSILLFVCSFLFAMPLFAGDPPAIYFENYTDREYEFLSTIRCIEQDSLGFMWFGTGEGLIRFDGMHFDLFRNDAENANSLSSNLIYSAHYEHHLNRLWVGNGYMNFSVLSLNDFAVDNGVVDRSILSEAIGFSYVSNVLDTGKDYLLLATEGYGIIKYHKATKKFSKIADDAGDEPWGNRCNCFFNDGNDIWAGTNRGLVRLDQSLQLQEWYDLKDTLRVNEIKSITLNGKDELLVATYYGFYRFSKQNKVYKKIVIDQPNLKKLVKHVLDDDGNIWVGTEEDGLFFIDSSFSEVINYRAQPGESQSLADNVVTDLYFSRLQPILWVSTNQGITKFDFQRNKFNAYDIRRLSGSEVANLFFLYKDSKGAYWFCDRDGVFRKKPRNERFEKVSFPGEQIDLMLTGGVAIGRHQHFFISTKGAFVFNAQTDVIRDVSNEVLDGLPISRRELFAVDIDEKGALWMSHRQGILKWHPLSKEKRFYKFPEAYVGDNGISVTDLAIDTVRGQVWVGSKSGYLIRFNQITENYTFFNSAIAPAIDRTIPNLIMDLNFDDQNRLWIATYGAGLLMFDEANQALSTEYRKGPVRDNIYCVEKDLNGCFWIANNFGITCFDPASGDYRYYDQSEGTFCHEFNERGHFQAADGEICLGGVGGFVTFNPSHIKEQKYEPAVIVKSFSLQDAIGELRTQKIHDENGKKRISIRSTKHPLRFYPAVLNHSVPEKNAIMWQLEGYDGTWYEASISQPIVFTNLVPGSYWLHIKEKSPIGSENTASDTVRINVIAPFYQQWWFRSFAGLFVLALIYIIYLVRGQIYKRQKAILEEKVNEKTIELKRTNEELEESQEEIMAQKEELEYHRVYLEELVNARTSDLEKAKIRAEESDRLKTAFLANLSHEVRTPMNAIIGFSSLLVEDEFDPITQKDFLKRILDNGESLLALIDDIVDISGIESGQVKMYHQEINIAEYLKNYFDSLFFKEKSPDTQLMLELDSVTAKCIIKSDPRRLQQILTNLLGNGVKFTKSGYVKLLVRKVSVSDLPKRNKILLPKGVDSSILLFSVVDTGIGIKSEHQELIFDAFRKVSSVDGIVYGGMGLGLNIVKRYVRLLGGDIWVESKFGKGTTISFYIACQ